jgi:1,4-alpha-glucan branching enzyme
MQTSAGGANQLKHFVRECHRKGIAVIFDVVYNHFSSADGERTEWGYDSDPNVAPQNNLWNWYEGMPSDYSYREGGYLNKGSSGYAPRLWEEIVRHTFTSSAAALLDDFHIDGLRVDLTDALHQNNSLNAGERTIASANQYGAKLMRELSRTVRLLKPTAFLVAEDYTGWTALRQPLSQGGVGFDAIWYMDFYHHLIGDGQPNPAYAGLLRHAGYGDGRSLNMDFFAGALAATPQTASYHESHDEAGNEDQTERTIVTAVNGAPLIDATRTYAEGRCRFCVRHGGALRWKPDDLHGRRDRGRQAVQIHRLRAEQGRSNRRPNRNRQESLQLLQRPGGICSGHACSAIRKHRRNLYPQR